MWDYTPVEVRTRWAGADPESIKRGGGEGGLVSGDSSVLPLPRPLLTQKRRGCDDHYYHRDRKLMVIARTYSSTYLVRDLAREFPLGRGGGAHNAAQL